VLCGPHREIQKGYTGQATGRTSEIARILLAHRSADAAVDVLGMTGRQRSDDGAGVIFPFGRLPATPGDPAQRRRLC
jgi:hypothetical protein